MLRLGLFSLFLISGCTGLLFKGASRDKLSSSPGSSGQQSIVLSLSVRAVYPDNGSNWNDYVLNNGSHHFDADDSACTGTEMGYDACLHGGEIKVVSFSPEIDECGALQLVDSLGVFNWRCEDSSGKVLFYSEGFKQDKGLRELLNESSWKDIKVVLNGSSKGQKYSGQSTAESWWSNPVLPLPDNSATGFITIDSVDDDGLGVDEAFVDGTIFTVATDRESSGFTIPTGAGAIQKIAVVTLEDSTLSYNGDATDNCAFGGLQCLFYSFVDFAWFEVQLDGAPAAGTSGDILLFIRNASFARIHNSLFVRYISSGTRMQNVSDSRVTYYKSYLGGSGSALSLWGSDYNRISNLRAEGGFKGILIYGNDNLISDVMTSNQRDYGIQFYSNASRNVLMNATIHNQDRCGIYFESGLTGSDNTVANVSIANNGSLPSRPSLRVDEGDNTTFKNIALINGEYGVTLSSGSDNNTFVNLAIGNHSGPAISFSNSNNNGFFGSLVFGNNTADCSDGGGGVNPGLIDVTCSDTGADGSTSYTGQLSTALFRPGHSLSFSFVGKAGSDLSNADHSGGSALYPGSPENFDWLSFDNFFRGWGLGGASDFPSATLRSQWTAGTGQIYDWRLLASDTILRNTSIDGNSQNPAFIENASCPIDGSQFATDQNTGGANTFLISASEILDDRMGDDDGLCESNESCVYTPNFGSYQGSGALIPCEFTNGVVSGVSLWGYETNGI